jgi:hypothetical protein
MPNMQNNGLISVYYFSVAFCDLQSPFLVFVRGKAHKMGAFHFIKTVISSCLFKYLTR